MKRGSYNPPKVWKGVNVPPWKKENWAPWFCNICVLITSCEIRIVSTQLIVLPTHEHWHWGSVHFAIWNPGQKSKGHICILKYTNVIKLTLFFRKCWLHSLPMNLLEWFWWYIYLSIYIFIYVCVCVCVCVCEPPKWCLKRQRNFCFLLGDWIRRVIVNFMINPSKH